MEKSGYITSEYVSTVITKRRRDAHKGDCGKILVIAGSKGMAGAAVLCGRAAYRAGAGLVRVSINEELYPIIQTALPEATCVPRRISEALCGGYDAIAIGPGLGSGAENEELTERILAGYGGLIVLDADGLNALARSGKTGLLKKTPAGVVITPHMGEARRLLEKRQAEWPGREDERPERDAERPERDAERPERDAEWPERDAERSESKRARPGKPFRNTAFSENDRLKIAEMLVEETGAAVVLKGADTIVASGSEGAYINTTGNPGMATGGSGDVLTGIIAALAGQMKNCWDAAKAGVFVHGMAGDMAAEAMGTYGMTAADIADMTAFAFKKIVG